MEDLFGQQYTIKDEICEHLTDQDRESLQVRRDNLAYIIQIAPQGGFVMEPESFYVFTEARDAFINGLYVATVLLAQSFIEHRLQIYMHELKQDKIAGKGLNSIIQWLFINKSANQYLWQKIDILRQFRNPFTHLKSSDHPNRISQIAINKRADPRHILFEKAKEAISLMYTIAIFELK